MMDDVSDQAMSGSPGEQSAPRSCSALFELVYPVTGQRFTCAYGSEAGVGDMLVAKIRFGGVVEKDLLRVLGRRDRGGADSGGAQILRVATPDEIERAKSLSERDEELAIRAKRVISQSKMKMKVLGAHLLPFSDMLVIFFSSNGRIDFRPLLAPLSREFKMAVNLQQMSFKTEVMGSDCCGSCGRGLCCRRMPCAVRSTRVTYKMVTEQMDAVNQQKARGPCGNLLCCFSFEEEFYAIQNSILPPKGSRIRGIDGEIYRVTDRNIFSGIVKAEGPEQTKRVFGSDDVVRTDDGGWREASGNGNAFGKAESQIG